MEITVCKGRPTGVGWLFLPQEMDIYLCSAVLSRSMCNGASCRAGWCTQMAQSKQELRAALEPSHFCFPLLQGLQGTGSGLSWVAQAGDQQGREVLWLLHQAASAWELLWSFTELFWTSSLVLTFDLLFVFGQVALFNLGIFRSLSNWFWALQMIS